MQVLIRVFVIMIIAGSGMNSIGNELIAQNTTHIVPASTGETYSVSKQESYVCSDEDTINTESHSPKINACSPDFVVEEDGVNTSNATNSVELLVENQEEVSILPNPEIGFVDEYMVKFDGLKSRNTIFYGGVVPFVALPDSELANQDRFFNEESFSIFLYFKRKF